MKKDKARKAIVKLDKAYLKSPNMVQLILNEQHGINMPLFEVKVLISEVYV